MNIQFERRPSIWPPAGVGVDARANHRHSNRRNDPVGTSENRFNPIARVAIRLVSAAGILLHRLPGQKLDFAGIGGRERSYARAKIAPVREVGATANTLKRELQQLEFTL